MKREADLITYNALLHACGPWQSAQELFHQVSQQLRPNDISYNACCKALTGQWLQIFSLLNQLVTRKGHPEALAYQAMVTEGPQLPSTLRELRKSWLLRLKSREFRWRAWKGGSKAWQKLFDMTLGGEFEFQ